ncbi:MAG: imelysin family protein [Halarcobacter sp.]
MRLIKVLLACLLLNLFAFADDTQQNKQVLKNIYDNVILKDIKKAVNDSKILEVSIKEKDIQKTKLAFTNLIKSWKSVEAFYILGDINEDYIDTPRYIDIFHNGNEDITEQLDRAINSSDSIRIVLFKNSLKSINALEYILYAKDIKNERVNQIALTINSKIKSYLEEIQEQYISSEEYFLSNLKKANSFVINALIQNTYKLKEWRIGDVMGATKKYEGKPDNKRAEYFLSKNSANAIESILLTYKKNFNSKKFENYGDYLIKAIQENQIKDLRDSIDKSLVLVKNIKNDDFSNVDKLYKEISNIHTILFLDIIEDLSINAKIIEADGD